MPQIIVTTPLDELMEGEESLLRFYIYKSDRSIEEILPRFRERMHPFSWDSMTNEEHINKLKSNLEYLDDLRIKITDITTICPHIIAQIFIFNNQINISISEVNPDDVVYADPHVYDSKLVDFSIKENGEVVLVYSDRTKAPPNREIHYKTTLFEGK